MSGEKQYYAFGMKFTSDLVLKLPSISALQTDQMCAKRSVSVIKKDLHAFPQLSRNIGKISWDIIDNALYVFVPWAARYFSPDCETLYWDPSYESFPQGATVGVGSTSGDESQIALYITALILPMLCARVGILLLHGSGITNLRRAWGFIGKQGAGKSTTATAMCALGYSLLCDDAIPIDFGPRMLPGIPYPKLLPDAYEKLIGDPSEAAHLFDGVDKFQTEVSSHFLSQPLAGFFALETADISTPEWSLVKGMQKMQILLPHITALPGFTAQADGTSKLFELVRETPLYLVRRPAIGADVTILAGMIESIIQGVRYD